MGALKFLLFFATKNYLLHTVRIRNQMLKDRDQCYHNLKTKSR